VIFLEKNYLTKRGPNCDYTDSELIEVEAKTITNDIIEFKYESLSRDCYFQEDDIVHFNRGEVEAPHKFYEITRINSWRNKKNVYEYTLTAKKFFCPESE
jgi:hypothetical protein